jgi:hypothetical protein
MPLRFPTEPTNGTFLVREGLNRLSTRKNPLSEKSIDFSSLQVSQLHPVYDLRADAVASGGGLASATRSGFRYLVESGGTAVAAAEIGVDTTGTATLLANINYGPYVEATAQALTNVSTLPPVTTGSYEVRLLRFAAIYLMAIWLKEDSGGADIIYPLAPAPAGLQAEQVYAPDEFIQAILPLAQKRAEPGRTSVS